MKSIKYIFCLSVVFSLLLMFSCRKNCIEPQKTEYSLIIPKESYQVGFTVNASKTFYIIKSIDEFEDILINQFKYSGNYRYSGETEMVIGLGVYIDHLGYEPLSFQVKEYTQKGVIEIDVQVKEKYKILNHNPGFRWI